MEITLADERAFVLIEQLTMDQAEGRAWSNKSAKCWTPNFCSTWAWTRWICSSPAAGWRSNWRKRGSMWRGKRNLKLFYMKYNMS